MNYPGWTACGTGFQPVSFRFWQPGGGFDGNIFPEKTVPAVIDYIHANPVRRGLVEHPTDWQWSSARFWQGRPNVPIRMDDPFA